MLIPRVYLFVGGSLELPMRCNYGFLASCFGRWWRQYTPTWAHVQFLYMFFMYTILNIEKRRKFRKMGHVEDSKHYVAHTALRHCTMRTDPTLAITENHKNDHKLWLNDHRASCKLLKPTSFCLPVIPKQQNQTILYFSH